MNVDQTDFQARVAEFYKVNGNWGFVIQKKPEPGDKREMDRARDEWFTYMDITKHHETLKFWQFLLLGPGSKQGLRVPCRTPEMFDIRYVAPDRIPDWSDREIEPERRIDISRIHERTMDSLRMSRPRGKRPPEPVHEVVETPAEWLARNEHPDPGSIPVLSDEALALYRGRA